MKKILLVTSLYPADDTKFLNNTSVCHYFAKEWVQMGYDVRVIYSYRIYSWYIYPLLNLFKGYLARTQAAALLDKRLDSVHSYIMDGVKIDRIPIKKNKPHEEFTDSEIIHHCKLITELLGKDHFVPDVILGHFISPALKIVSTLKDSYPNATTAVSMHGKSQDQRKDKVVNELLSEIDFVGYRSHSIHRSFESTYGKRPFFLCPSGVPEEYIVDSPRVFDGGIRSFIYVGNFMDRKHPTTVVEATAKSMYGLPYTLTFVGNGDGRNAIIKTAKRCGNLENVKFTGRIPREQVTSEMDKADVFIMVSENETFGLVYLEAMSRGCIVIASRNEGMDGYIIDGRNGFLCEAGNSDELAAVIKRVVSLPQKELQALSVASLETARAMTDRKVAADYISVFE